MKGRFFTYHSQLLLVLTILLFSGWVANAQLMVTLSARHPCPGQSDGEITATATGGTGTYEYKLGINGGYQSNNIFTGRVAGSDTIYVKDDAAEPATATGSAIIQLVPISVTLFNTKNYTCGVDPPCEGSLEFMVAGGNTPYADTTIKFDEIPYSGELDELCAGTYVVTVTDYEGCTASSDDFSVSLDTENPTLSDEGFPDDYFMTLTDFNNLPSVADTFGLGSVVLPYTYVYDAGNTIYDTITFGPFDAINHNRLDLRLRASQTAVAFGVNDFIKIRIDYGTGTFNDLFIDRGRWTGVYDDTGGDAGIGTNTLIMMPDSIPLPGADGKTGIYIQVICRTSVSGQNYTIDTLVVRGNSPNKLLSAYSGQPSGCADDFECTVEYTDDPIVWENLAPATQEFYIMRKWFAEDGCGKTSPIRQQRIAVGDYPVVATPRDTTLSFCHFANVAIPIPVYSDISDPNGVYIHWKVTYNDIPFDPVLEGTPLETDVIIEITLPQPVLNDTLYTITWTATDDAGFQDSIKQSVTILKPITAILTPAKVNFCTGETVSFTVTVTGGTRVYNTPVITPGVATPWAWTTPNVMGTFTTSNLILAGAEDISITFTDANSIPLSAAGGCVKQFDFLNGTHYTIHKNITTNPVQRNP